MSRISQLPATAIFPTGSSLVVVVDDDHIVRSLLGTTLEYAGFRVETYASAEDLLSANWDKEAACLLLDAGLPGMSGLELLERLSQAGNGVPVVMLTGSNDVKLAVAVMKAGACDYIEKPANENALRGAIERAIQQRKSGADLNVLREKATKFMNRLTSRQREILELIIDGNPNKNIAADLSLSQRTVENHRAAIMKRAGVKSLPALAKLVFAANLSPQQTPPSQLVQAITAAAVPAVTGESENSRFERYFDHIPLAVAVSAMTSPEHVIYANHAFEQLSGRTRSDLEGQPWTSLTGASTGDGESTVLGAAIIASSDFVGMFRIFRPDNSSAMADVFSNVIVDDNDGPMCRLVAFVDVSSRDNERLQEFEHIIRDKDARLLEIQHRVKNNLQMITALIRIEARKAQGQTEKVPFDRLAGRINSIQIVYKLLTESGGDDEIDLGVYLSEIASSIMHSSAIEGIRLELKVDAYPVSINVALPTGMVVNELLTNSLRHAFVDRDGGTITLQSLTDAHGCRVVIADDGVGLPPDVPWPKRGKLGELIVQSLRQNAQADVVVESRPGEGMRVTITFTRRASAPIA